MIKLLLLAVTLATAAVLQPQAAKLLQGSSPRLQPTITAQQLQPARNGLQPAVGGVPAVHVYQAN